MDRSQGLNTNLSNKNAFQVIPFVSLKDQKTLEMLFSDTSSWPIIQKGNYFCKFSFDTNSSCTRSCPFSGHQEFLKLLKHKIPQLKQKICASGWEASPDALHQITHCSVASGVMLIPAFATEVSNCNAHMAPGCFIHCWMQLKFFL